MDTVKEAQGDFVEKCQKQTEALRDCMMADPGYYGRGLVRGACLHTVKTRTRRRRLEETRTILSSSINSSQTIWEPYASPKPWVNWVN